MELINEMIGLGIVLLFIIGFVIVKISKKKN